MVEEGHLTDRVQEVFDNAGDDVPVSSEMFSSLSRAEVELLREAMP